MRTTAFVILALCLAPGCKNSCQQICVNMAKYAEEDCGLTVPQSAIDCCVEAQEGDASIDDRATCSEFGDIETIKSTWSCNDLEDYAPFSGDQCNAS